MLQVTEYTVRSQRIRQSVRFAVATDLHNGPYREALEAMQGVDAILIVGDLINRHRPGHEQALGFLREAPEIAPVFYSVGNHERRYPRRAEYWPQALNSRAMILDNAYIRFHGVVLGGLSSAEKGAVQAGFLRDMAREEGFRLLMCHHPEYFRPYVVPYEIDLTLSGHAHGGQVQLWGRGLYAPGQGLLPRLTHGFYENDRLLVSRGMTNSTWAPRIGNPCEMILLHLEGEDHA